MLDLPFLARMSSFLEVSGYSFMLLFSLIFCCSYLSEIGPEITNGSSSVDLLASGRALFAGK